MLPRKRKRQNPKPRADWPTMFIVEIGNRRIPFKLVDGVERFSHDGKDVYDVAAILEDHEVRVSNRQHGETLERAIGRAILAFSANVLIPRTEGGNHGNG